MKLDVRLLVVLGLLLQMLPATNAATAVGVGGAGGSCDHYYHQGIAQVGGVINAGDLEVWGGTEACEGARSPNQAMIWVGRISAPAILAASSTITWSSLSLTGCSVSAFTSTTDSFAVASGGSTYATITMTSNECRGAFQVDLEALNALAVVVFRNRVVIPVDIIVPSQAIYAFNCGNTGTTSNAVDPDSSTCGGQSLSVAITSWPTLTATVSNSGTLTLSGSLSVANSGTQHLAIDSWPTLTANVANSGTINVVNSGGQTFTLSCSGSCPTLNVATPSGITVAVSSWPQLQAVLSGTVNANLSGTITSILGGGISLRGGNATVGNTTFNVSDATLAKWVPLLLVALEIVGAAVWSNPFLIVAGVLGFFHLYVNKGWSEATWLMMSIFAVILPSLPRLFPKFLARIRGR